jgi:hypothetical protein
MDTVWKRHYPAMKQKDQNMGKDKKICIKQRQNKNQLNYA